MSDKKYKHYGSLPDLPKTMPIKEAELLVGLLKEIRRSATFKQACIPDEVIKASDLYRHSWIIAPLDDLIKRYSRE